MTPFAWHVVLRLADRGVIAASVPARRRLAATVLELGADRGLLAFRGSDTHLHLLVVGSRAEAGRLAQGVACALRWRLGLDRPFDGASVRPVEEQRHLESAFDYILRQHLHHGFASDPWHDASVLPDLLGLRVAGAVVAAAARERLPRVDRARLLAILGVPRLEPSVDPDLVPEAAAAAACLPDLAARGERRTAALRAAARVLEDSVAPARAARLLGIGRSTFFRLRDEEPPALLVRAIRLQVGFRRALASIPSKAP